METQKTKPPCSCGHPYTLHDTGWDAAGCMDQSCSCRSYNPCRSCNPCEHRCIIKTLREENARLRAENEVLTVAHPGVYIRRYKEAVDRAAAALKRVEELEQDALSSAPPYYRKWQRAEAKLARCVEALNLVLPGLDDNWSQIPEGMAAIEAARAALAAAKGE